MPVATQYRVAERRDRWSFELAATLFAKRPRSTVVSQVRQTLYEYPRDFPPVVAEEGGGDGSGVRYRSPIGLRPIALASAV